MNKQNKTTYNIPSFLFVSLHLSEKQQQQPNAITLESKRRL